jgi:hypothetical protein
MRTVCDADIQEFIDKAERNMPPDSLRDLATTLLKFADSIDQNWNPEKIRSSFSMFSEAAMIERNSLSLSSSANLEEHRSKIRDDAFGADLVRKPAWNILLELFKQFSEGAKVSTKSLQLIARCPETTALRVIDRLEERRLAIRSQSHSDRRVTFIALSNEGVVKVGSVVDRFGDY